MIAKMMMWCAVLFLTIVSSMSWAMAPTGELPGTSPMEYENLSPHSCFLAFINTTYIGLDGEYRSDNSETGKFGETYVRPATGVLIHVRSRDTGDPTSCTLPLATNSTPDHRMPTTEPWIALIKRGNCDFAVKVRHALRYNASAVLIYNDREASVLDKMSIPADLRNVSAVFTYKNKGEFLASLTDAGIQVMTHISVGSECTGPPTNINRPGSFRLRLSICDPELPSGQCVHLWSHKVRSNIAELFKKRGDCEVFEEVVCQSTEGSIKRVDIVVINREKNCGLVIGKRGGDNAKELRGEAASEEQMGSSDPQGDASGDDKKEDATPRERVHALVLRLGNNDIPNSIPYRSCRENALELTKKATRLRVGMSSYDPRQQYSTSVLFVSISFIVLMIISLAWLVFYYVQRFRYIHAKDRLSRRLCSAAKKALSKIPTKNIKSEDKEIQGDGECCAVCIEPYKVSDVLRILPCRHEFHKYCIDPWLLEHRTCPMCKMDILKHYGFVAILMSRPGLSSSASRGFTGSQESILHMDIEDVASLGSSANNDTDRLQRRTLTPISEIPHSDHQDSGLSSPDIQSRSSRASSPDELTPTLCSEQCYAAATSRLEESPSLMETSTHYSTATAEAPHKPEKSDTSYKCDCELTRTPSCDMEDCELESCDSLSASPSHQVTGK